jgi:hypothetical protein
MLTTMHRVIARHASTLGFALLLTLATSRDARAGDPPILSCDESASGFSSGEVAELVRFTGEAGQVVSLNIESCYFSSDEPEIDLCPPSGTAPILSGVRGLLPDITLPETGTYDIFVRASGGGGNGGATWKITYYSLFPSESVCTGQPLALGQEISSTIDRDCREHLYTFSGAAGQTIEVDTFFEDFNLDFISADFWEPGWSVFDQTGGALVASGPKGLHQVTVPDTGSYLLRVRNESNFDTAPVNFDLVVRESSPIACGATVSTRCGLARASFPFSGDTGDVLSMSFVFFGTSSEEPEIDVCPPTSETLVVDGTMQPVDFTLTETGKHTILALSDSFSGGMPEMKLNLYWLWPPEKTCPDAEIVFGQETSDSTDQDHLERTYSFHGIAVQRISINFVEGPGRFWTPEYQLFAPADGAIVAMGEEGLQEVVLPDTGQYTLRVRARWIQIAIYCPHTG